MSSFASAFVAVRWGVATALIAGLSGCALAHDWEGYRFEDDGGTSLPVVPPLDGGVPRDGNGAVDARMDGGGTVDGGHDGGGPVDGGHDGGPPDPLVVEPAPFVIGAGSSALDDVQAVAVDDEGNVFFGGALSGAGHVGPRALPSDGAHDGFIAKVDPTGDLAWVFRLGGTGNVRVHDLALDSEGNPIATGWFVSELEAGDERFSTVGPGDDDVFVVKLDSEASGADPHLLWANVLTGNGRDAGLGLTVDEADRVFVVGEFQNTLYPHRESEPVVTAGAARGMFLARFAADGAAEALVAMGGDGDDEAFGQGVAVTGGGQVVVVGRHTGTLRFDETRSHTSQHGFDAFVVAFDADLGVRWARSLGSAPSACQGSDARATEVVQLGGGDLLVSGHHTDCLAYDTLPEEPPEEADVLTLGNGSFRPFALRFSDAGTLRRELGTGFPGTRDGPAWAHDAFADAAGGYVLTGGLGGSLDFGDGPVLPSHGGRDGWIARFDAAGSLVFLDVFGGPGDDVGFSCAEGPGGRLVVGGEFTGTIRTRDGGEATVEGLVDGLVVGYAPADE